MSLILDALNKNERERQSPRNVPDLGAGSHYAPPPPNTHLKALLIGVVILALLVVALLIALLLRPGAPAAVTPPPPLAVNPAPAPPANPLVTADTPAPREPVQSWRPMSPPPAPSEIAPVTPTASAPSVEDVAALYAPENTAPERGQPVEREQMATLWQEMQTQPLPPQPRPQRAPAAAQPAPAQPAVPAPQKLADPEGLAQFNEIPYLHELPPQQQSKLPTLMYNKHDFGGGSVYLNKKRFIVGQSPAPGVTVEQIVTDGVVLAFEGRQFKLDALSSWVNR